MSVNILKNKAFYVVAVILFFISCDKKVERQFFKKNLEMVVFNDSNSWNIGRFGVRQDGKDLFDCEINLLNFRTSEGVKCYMKDGGFFLVADEKSEFFFALKASGDTINHVFNYHIAKIMSQDDIHIFILYDDIRSDGIEPESQYTVISIDNDRGFLGAAYYDAYNGKLDQRTLIGQLGVNDTILFERKIKEVISLVSKNSY